VFKACNSTTKARAAATSLTILAHFKDTEDKNMLDFMRDYTHFSATDDENEATIKK
jgi:hypothetical protein